MDRMIDLALVGTAHLARQQTAALEAAGCDLSRLRIADGA
jgi:hypothetical protein